MPHRKNHMKLTGDTHPPEVEYEQVVDDDALDDDPATATATATATGTIRSSASDAAPPPLEGIRFDRPAGRAAGPLDEAAPAWSESPALESARAFTRTRPLAALGITLVAGYALLKLLRR
jgi:hypothetical protein